MEFKDRRPYDGIHIWPEESPRLMGYVLYNHGLPHSFLRDRFPHINWGDGFNKAMILGESLRADIEFILAHSAEHDEPNTYFLLSAVMAAWMDEHGI